ITALAAGIEAIHPARILLLIGEADGGKPELKAYVQAQCRRGPGGRKACSEQITLHARGSAVDRLGFTVRRLLIGDLPTNLWWAAAEPPPFGGPLLYDLAERTQQIIYDSLGWREPARGVAATASWI